MTYDVIVLGLGGMGSAAAHHLARRGRRVLGLDRFAPAHDQGSSHGRSRIVREAYWEHPSYVPLVRRAYELWADLERAHGRRLLLTTGGIVIGPRDSDLVQGSITSARTHGLRHEVLDPPAIRNRFPVFAPGDEMIGVFEPRAGVLFVEECVRAHLQQAAHAGAELHHDEPVLEWTATPQGAEVHTARARYQAAHLVITAGPWAPTVLADLALPLVIERQVVAWFRPVALDGAFDASRCPVHIWWAGGRFFYGTPQLGDGLVKLAEHAVGHPTTADTIRREIAAGEIEGLRRDFVARYMPAANGDVAASGTCMYTMSPDTHFIIDVHPRHSNVVIASGFSGHGYKFAPVIGEILADLVVEGKTRYDISLFAVGRFEARRTAV
ncbi:MAG: N-methyl-L-tryptophan oxidase [Armatimonadota bacterium]